MVPVTPEKAVRKKKNSIKPSTDTMYAKKVALFYPEDVMKELWGFLGINIRYDPNLREFKILVINNGSK